MSIKEGRLETTPELLKSIELTRNATRRASEEAKKLAFMKKLVIKKKRSL